VSIIYSIILYGAPVWLENIMENTRIRGMIDRITRRLVQRTCRAYRTVSRVSAVPISGIIPSEYIAKSQAMVYNEIRSVVARGVIVDARTREKLHLRKKGCI
jgi:hypothetical protein